MMSFMEVLFSNNMMFLRFLPVVVLVSISVWFNNILNIGFVEILTLLVILKNHLIKINLICLVAEMGSISSL